MNDEHLAICQQEAKRVEEEIGDALEEIDLVQKGISHIGSTRFIRGKTIKAWEEEFLVNFNYQATPIHVNMILEKLATNLNKANKFCSQAKHERAIFKTYYSKEIQIGRAHV